MSLDTLAGVRQVRVAPAPRMIPHGREYPFAAVGGGRLVGVVVKELSNVHWLDLVQRRLGKGSQQVLNV